MFKIIFIVGIFLFIGCVPKIITTIPKINGVVLDNQTKQPISNVQICIEQFKQSNIATLRNPNLKKYQSVSLCKNKKTIYTTNNGKFSFEAKNDIGIATTMGGIYNRGTVIIHIFKKNYKPQDIPCDTLSNEDSCPNIKVFLEPYNNGL